MMGEVLMEFGYLDHITLLIQGSFFHSILFLRSTKNAFIMQTKSTFFWTMYLVPPKNYSGANDVIAMEHLHCF